MLVYRSLGNRFKFTGTYLGTPPWSLGVYLLRTYLPYMKIYSNDNWQHLRYERLRYIIWSGKLKLDRSCAMAMMDRLIHVGRYIWSESK